MQTPEKTKKSSYQIAVLIEDERFLEKSPEIEDICIETCIATLLSTPLPEYFNAMEITVSLSGDEMIQTLNQRFLSKDKPTNVLSFPAAELNLKNYREFPAENILLGDIILAFDTIEKEAREQKKQFIHHFRHLVIHAVLHLIGYDHEEEEAAEEMEALEIKLLADYGISNPYEV